MPAELTEKARLRALMRARLRDAPPRDSAMLCRKLAELDALARTDCLVAFLAFQHEPQTDSFLENWLANHKRLILPRFQHESRNYELVEVTNLTSQTTPGFYGIREPKSQLVAIQALSENCAWLVPGLAFTTSGSRLGRGAGYYDRLFTKFPQGKRIGIAWEMQLLPEIPIDPWDVRMDFVVTEARTLECASST